MGINITLSVRQAPLPLGYTLSYDVYHSSCPILWRYTHNHTHEEEEEEGERNI